MWNGIRSGLVYCIDCRDCQGVYISQTGRQLGIRVAEHRRDVRNLKTSSALSEHATNLNHSFDFDSVKVLVCEKNLKKRLFYEMVQIYYSSNSINKRTDIDNLSNIYTYILSLNPNRGIT